MTKLSDHQTLISQKNLLFYKLKESEDIDEPDGVYNYSELATHKN